MWGDLSYPYTTAAAASYRCMVKYGKVFACPMLPTIITNLSHPDCAPFLYALAIVCDLTSYSHEFLLLWY